MPISKAKRLVAGLEADKASRPSSDSARQTPSMRRAAAAAPQALLDKRAALDRNTGSRTSNIMEGRETIEPLVINAKGSSWFLLVSREESIPNRLSVNDINVRLDVFHSTTFFRVFPISHAEDATIILGWLVEAGVNPNIPTKVTYGSSFVRCVNQQPMRSLVDSVPLPKGVEIPTGHSRKDVVGFVNDTFSKNAGRMPTATNRLALAGDLLVIELGTLSSVLISSHTPNLAI